jgi:hypothetical protein
VECAYDSAGVEGAACTDEQGSVPDLDPLVLCDLSVGDDAPERYVPAGGRFSQGRTVTAQGVFVLVNRDGRQHGVFEVLHRQAECASCSARPPQGSRCRSSRNSPPDGTGRSEPYDGAPGAFRVRDLGTRRQLSVIGQATVKTPLLSS